MLWSPRDVKTCGALSDEVVKIVCLIKIERNESTIIKDTEFLSNI